MPSLLKAVMAGKEGTGAGAAEPKASPRPPNASNPPLEPGGAAEGSPESRLSKSCTQQTGDDSQTLMASLLAAAMLGNLGADAGAAASEVPPTPPYITHC